MRVVTDQFNELVQASDYDAAIELVAKVKVTDANRAALEPLRRRAATLNENLTAVRKAADEEVGELISDLKDSRLADIEVRAKLRKKLSIDFQDVTLEATMAMFAKSLDLDIVFDSGGLAAEGIARDHPVNLKLRRSTSAKNALDLILSPLNLKYRVDRGIMQITSHTSED